MLKEQIPDEWEVDEKVGVVPKYGKIGFVPRLFQEALIDMGPRRCELFGTLIFLFSIQTYTIAIFVNIGRQQLEINKCFAVSLMLFSLVLLLVTTYGYGHECLVLRKL